MDLRTFIKETLVQIAQGIEDANASLKESHALVNPRRLKGVEVDITEKVYGFLDENAPPKNYRRVAQLIKFDVAIRAAKGDETKGGIGIVVGAIALGSQGKSDSSSTSESRVQFQIPMVFPTSDDPTGGRC